MKTLTILYDTDDWKYKIPYATRSPYSGRLRRSSFISLSKIAKKHGIKLTRASSLWYEKGIFKKAWIYDNGWKKIKNLKADIIFDKTPLNDKTLKIKKKLSREIKIFNDLFVEKLCSDKLTTYRYFRQFMPNTFLINNKKQLKKILPKIRTQKIVIKPRAGSSAKNIKFTSKKKLLKKISKESVVQEFIDVSGVPGFVKGVSDLRIITINGKIAIASIRHARKGLISNVSRGGREIVIDIKKIPNKVKAIVRKIDSKLSTHKPRIYTSDFVFDKNNKPWLMELNSKPGLFGYERYPKDKKRLETNLILAVKKSI